MNLNEKKIKYAKSKLGRIEFKYSENMSTRGDGNTWAQSLVEAHLNGKKIGYLKMDYIADKKFWEVFPNKEAFQKYFNEAFTDRYLNQEYKKFYYHWVDCPVVDFIKVEENYKRNGIGYVLYIAGAMWLAEKNMCLHASSLQADEASAAWKKLEAVGLPVKNYKNQAGENRKCLDYRKRR